MLPEHDGMVHFTRSGNFGYKIQRGPISGEFLHQNPFHHYNLRPGAQTLYLQNRIK